jgi:hypothetical protein
MQISTDHSLNVLKMAVKAPAAQTGEAREPVRDNERAEAMPAKSALKAHQGTKIDVSA